MKNCSDETTESELSLEEVNGRSTGACASARSVRQESSEEVERERPRSILAPDAHEVIPKHCHDLALRISNDAHVEVLAGGVPADMPTLHYSDILSVSQQSAGVLPDLRTLRATILVAPCHVRHHQSH